MKRSINSAKILFPENRSRLGSNVGGVITFHLKYAPKHYENLRVKKTLLNFVYAVTNYIIGSLDSVKSAYTRP